MAIYNTFLYISIEDGFKGKTTIAGNFKDDPHLNGKSFVLTGDTGENTFKILRKNKIIPNYQLEEENSMFMIILIK